MRSISEEKVLLLLFGEKKFIELNNKIIDEYKNNYAEIFGHELENIEILQSNIYKFIIEIGMGENLQAKLSIKMYDNRILEINKDKFYNRYKEYIKEIEDAYEKVKNTFN